MSIPEFHTDQIETVGIVKRIYFHLRHEKGGISNWYYFGTDPAIVPPTTGDPVFEYPYIQFPNDLDALPEVEADIALFDLGLIAAKSLQGLD